MKSDSKIYVAGHSGLLGSALIKKLNQKSYSHILTQSHRELDLLDFGALEAFFEKNAPEYIFLAAGRTGGIQANKTYPADFFYENSAIQNNFFRLAHKYKTKALVFFASSCIYPQKCPQPMKEEHLFQGPLEPSSQAYAAAKLSGLLACQAYNQQYPDTRMICLLPNSLYGPFDNFDLENSHVLSALIRKIHDAKINNQAAVTLWGSGEPRREFVFSEDAAEAAIFSVLNMNKLENTHYNVGTGHDYSIKELAKMIALVVGYKGEINFDTSKPDGAPRKLLDSSKFLRLGWAPTVDLEKGIGITYDWFKNRNL